MDPAINPFVPGAGASPQELIGRDDLIETARIAFDRVKAGRPARSFIAVGLRGVGKTVLLNHVRGLAEQASHRVCVIEAHESKPLAALLVLQIRRLLLEFDRVGALSEQVKRGLRVLKSFVAGLEVKNGEAELSLDIDPEPGAADSRDLDADLPELLAAVGRAAKSRGSAAALIMDEIQHLNARDVGALITAMHRVAQDSLPVLLVAAGLPQVVGLSGRAKSSAERLFDFPCVGELSPADARRAIVQAARSEGVEFEPQAVDDIVAITRGYPYSCRHGATTRGTWRRGPPSRPPTLRLPTAGRSGGWTQASSASGLTA